jgi:hypothetical protein
MQVITFSRLTEKYKNKIEKIHKAKKKYAMLLDFGLIIFSHPLADRRVTGAL